MNFYENDKITYYDDFARKQQTGNVIDKRVEDLDVYGYCNIYYLILLQNKKKVWKSLKDISLCLGKNGEDLQKMRKLEEMHDLWKCDIKIFGIDEYVFYSLAMFFGIVLFIMFCILYHNNFIN